MKQYPNMVTLCFWPSDHLEPEYLTLPFEPNLFDTLCRQYCRAERHDGSWCFIWQDGRYGCFPPEETLDLERFIFTDEVVEFYEQNPPEKESVEVAESEQLSLLEVRR